MTRPPERRVLLLITGAFTVGGGVAALNRLVLKALSDWGGGHTQLTVLALNEPEGTPLDAFYADPGRTVWRPFGGRIGRFAIGAWSEALRHRGDLIFADYVGVVSVIYPLARLGLCRYSVSCIGLELSPELLSLRRRLALFAAERRLAISPTTRDRLQALFPGLPVSVCELALDPKLDVDASWDHEASPIILRALSGQECRLGERVILCVGRMWRDQRHKGQDALIRAMFHVRERFPNAQLVLAGGGDWVEELKALARAQGLADCVFMPGFIGDELREWLYARCAVFAMPSKAEGFGLVYLEAMRWAKPCVGGAQDAARDVVVDEETGVLLVDQHNPRLLGRALAALLGDPLRARRLGEAGRRRLKERYLFRHFCARFYAAIGWG